MSETTTNGNIISKIRKLGFEIKNENEIAYNGSVWGSLAKTGGQVTFYNPNSKNARTKLNVLGIESIQAIDGKLIVIRDYGDKKPLEYLPKDEPDTQNFENGPIPEMADFENLPKEILDFQSKINDKLIVEKDDFGQYQLRDHNKNDYAMIQRDLKTICFWDRGNNPKYDLRPSLYRIKKIDLLENQTIQVDFNDGTQAIYNPQVKPKESKRKEIQTDDTPKDEFVIFNSPTTLRYSNDYTTIEECLRCVFTDDLLKECLYRDELDGRIYFNPKLIGTDSSKIEPYNANWELTELIQILEKKYSTYDDRGILKIPKITKYKVDDVVIKLGKKNIRNTFIDRIRATESTGTCNIKTFLRDIGITTRLKDPEKSEIYLEAVSCALFLAIIERQLHKDGNRPLRFVPILIGTQRNGKSTICRKLALDDTRLFKESTKAIDDLQKYLEQIVGGVIVEIAEGTQFIVGKQDSYKAYFDMNVIQYRKPYDREVTENFKQYFEIITTNDNEILTDVTGNTRYYPLFLDGIEEPVIPIYDFTVEDILQLYANALERYEQGERWYTHLERPEIFEIADLVRATVTKDIIGLDEIITLAETEYSEIGSFMTNDSIREYLRNDPYYYDDKIINKAMGMFAKSHDLHGFRKESDPTKIKDENGKWKSYRGYRRIKPPKGKE